MVSVFCFFAVALIKPRLGYDDSLDVFGVHCVGGIWGALATGLFASKAINPGWSERPLLRQPEAVRDPARGGRRDRGIQLRGELPHL